MQTVKFTGFTKSFSCSLILIQNNDQNMDPLKTLVTLALELLNPLYSHYTALKCIVTVGI